MVVQHCSRSVIHSIIPFIHSSSFSQPLDLKKLIDDLTSERATLSDAASRLDGSCCELKETNTVV